LTRTNRAAFQSLLTKLREPETHSVLRKMSCPVACSASEKRRASVPYRSISSSGSITLPSDLDILRP
jgi:hypothetical protein